MFAYIKVREGNNFKQTLDGGVSRGSITGRFGYGAYMP